MKRRDFIKTSLAATVVTGHRFAGAESGEDMPLVQVNIHWPTFLARHDMLWKRLPGNWREAPWTGNGMLGSMFWIEGNALRIQAFRGDVQAHRPMTQGFSGYTRARLQIGSHYLAPVGKPAGCDLRLSYYDAEVVGTINTEKGAWKIRHFTHAEDMAIVTELEAFDREGPVQLIWQPDKNAMPTRPGYARTKEDLPRLQKQYKSRYPTEPFPPNPDAVVKSVDDVNICIQDMLGESRHCTAWRMIETGKGKQRLVVSIANRWPKETGDSVAEAVAVVKKVCALTGPAYDAWKQKHYDWWHAYYPASFVSVPDTEVETVYWTTMYKLGSATMIVRVNMLKVTAADWTQIPGVKNAWPMKGFEGVPGMAFHPIISEVKDVDSDGKPDIFRCRSEHPGARVERRRYDDGSVVWESEPLGALHGDESRLPVFDLHGDGRFSVLHATTDGTWCINADTGETEWAARDGRGDIIVGHFLDKKTQAVVVRDGGVLHCYEHTGKKAWTHDTELRGGAAYSHEMGRCDVDGNGLDEIFANWQKLTMGLRGDGTVLWEDRTQRHHSDFVDYGDVDGDGNIEVIYDHEGCGAAKGPIYVVEPLSGKIKAKIDYRQQGIRHAQNIALGNFDKTTKGLEIAFCEKGSNIYLFDSSGKLVWKRPVPASLLSKGDWDGDGDEEVLAFGLGANVDGMFSVWDGDGTRLYAISFLPSPYSRMLDNATYKKNLGGTWRAHAMPGGHEGIRRQVDLDGNNRADVIMPFGEWHWGSDSILFLMEGRPK